MSFPRAALRTIGQVIAAPINAYFQWVFAPTSVVEFDDIIQDPRSITSLWSCRVVVTRRGGHYDLILEMEGPPDEQPPVGVFSCAACEKAKSDPLRTTFWVLDRSSYPRAYVIRRLSFSAFEATAFYLPTWQSVALPTRVRKALAEVGYPLDRVLVVK